jgi:hypothetical protein
MKDQVLNYLKTDRSFDGAVRLLNKIPGASLALRARAQRVAPNAEFHEAINYQLCKLVGITEQQMAALLKEPLGAAEIVISDIQEARSVKATEFHAPEPEVKRGAALRQEFPFLLDKDCPMELKVLVADKMNAFYTFKANHEQLFEATTEQELAAAVEGSVEAFIDNQLIYRELDHYREHKKVLGEHPIFTKLKLQEEIGKLSGADLVKRRNAVIKSINSAKAAIEKGDRPDLDEKRQETIAHRTMELELVDQKLESLK